MAHLGWRDRAYEELQWLMQYRRPAGFQHWAEVVWNDERAPHFIGDMPHTWCGTDYVRSVLDMLAYEDESDSSLVIGAGIPEEWTVRGGVIVKGLRTRWGTLSYTLRRGARPWNADLLIEAGGLRVPPGGIRVQAPTHWGFAQEVGFSQPEKPLTLVVRQLPAHVRLRRNTGDKTLY